MKLCRHEVRAARGEGGAKVRILSFPLQCNRGGGPAFGRLSARILGFALWACQCPHSGLRDVGVPVPAFWASRCGRASARILGSRCGCASARILGLAVWFGAHSAPASCLRAVGAGVLALILGVRRQLRRVVIIT